MRKRNKNSPKDTSEKVALALTKHDEVTIQVGGEFIDAKTLTILEHVSPDLRERILEMAEKEQEHRHTLENELAKADIEDMKKERVAITRGQWFAFLTTIFALSLGGFLLLSDRPIEGFILSGATLTGVIISLVKSGRKRNLSKTLS